MSTRHNKTTLAKVYMTNDKSSDSKMNDLAQSTRQNQYFKIWVFFWRWKKISLNDERPYSNNGKVFLFFFAKKPPKTPKQTLIQIRYSQNIRSCTFERQINFVFFIQFVKRKNKFRPRNIYLNEGWKRLFVVVPIQLWFNC